MSEEVRADPLEQLTARELFAAFDEELSRLPASYRESLVLCYLQGRSQEEAAQQLGWSLSTVRRRLERGRKLLHTRMARRGLSLPALAAVLLSRQEATAALAVPALPDAFSARATVLADAILRAAVRTSLKATAALLVMLGVLAAGTGWAVRHMLMTGPSQTAAVGQPESPKGDTAERTDQYGDPLPPGAIARLGTSRLRHADGYALMFSQDGKRLISCDRGGEVRVWDTATGKLVRRTRLMGKAREYISYSGCLSAPGGATAKAWDGQTTYLYDTATGQEAQPVAQYPTVGVFFGWQEDRRASPG